MSRDAWVVRAGRGGVNADSFEEEGVIAVGFRVPEDLSGLRTRSEFMSRVDEIHPSFKDGRKVNVSSQLYRFVHEIEQDDLVLSPISDTREILFGSVKSGYRYEPGRIEGSPHVRDVAWSKRVSRDELSVKARNSAGSTLTLFSMNDHREELERIFEGRPSVNEESLEDEEAEEIQLYEEVRGKAEELISDRIAHMDPFDFEELVAALLRAMGYHARVTEAGPDRGVDIVAHPDALGLEAPRIKVQVKQRNQRMGSSDMRNFSATLREGERGLFVSTGGFSREAMYEAERVGGRISLTTVDRDQFVELLTEHYDQLAPEARALLPLKKIYLPMD